MEYRRKCKVCGKIWCYTASDLRANSMNAFSGAVSALGGIANVVGGGSIFHQQYFADRAEHNTDKVVNYEQCPGCRSLDTVLLTDEEWEEAQTQESFANVRVSINANATTEALLIRIKLLLEDKDWPNANAYCDAVLDAEPENAMAYVYKLMAELRVSEQADLANHKVPFDTKPNYQKAVRFADDSLQQTLKGYIAHINERNEQERLDGLYSNACAAMQQSATEEAYKNAASLFAAIKGHKDADSLQAECLNKAEQARLEAERKAAEEKAAAAEQAKETKKLALIAASIVVVAIVAVVLISNFMKAQQEEAARLDAYNTAVALVEAGQYDEAIATFIELGDYKDSMEQIKEPTYQQAVSLLDAEEYDKAISIFMELEDYKDSAEQITEATYRQAVAIAGSLQTPERAIPIFTKLGDYKDSAVIARQLQTEYDTYQNALTHYAEGDLGPALDLIRSNPQYIKFSQEEEEKIKFIAALVGNWTYKSGNDQTLDIMTLRGISRIEADTIKNQIYFMGSTNSSHVESIQIEFLPQESAVLVSYGEYENLFEIDGDCLQYEITKNISGQAKIMQSGALRFSITLNDKKILNYVCDYQRVQ